MCKFRRYLTGSIYAYSWCSGEIPWLKMTLLHKIREISGRIVRERKTLQQWRSLDWILDCGLTVCVSMLRQPTRWGEHSDWSAHFLLTTTLSPRESMICSVWQKSSPTENHITHVHFNVRDNIWRQEEHRLISNFAIVCCIRHDTGLNILCLSLN